MLLAIDVGNTHTVIGLFEGDTLRRHWRIRTEHSRTADEYSAILWNLSRMSSLEPDQILAGKRGSLTHDKARWRSSTASRPSSSGTSTSTRWPLTVSIRRPMTSG